MFKIEDGRSKFYQWDLNRKLVVKDSTIKEVHFANRSGACALVCNTYTENGNTVVDVPNVLLQENWKIYVYAYIDYTKYEQCFEVVSRTKPDDYVYTEIELKRYDDFEERITALEEEDVAIYGAIEEAKEEAIEEVEIKGNALLEKAKTQSKVSGSVLSGNSHRDVYVKQGNQQVLQFNCMGKQNGSNGQSWYLTDYTNSKITGDYSASLGFNNESIGNGNIIGGIKNDISGRGCLSIGEKNVLEEGNTGNIIFGNQNNIKFAGDGNIIGGELNSVDYAGTGAIHLGYNNKITGTTNPGWLTTGAHHKIKSTGASQAVTVLGSTNTVNKTSSGITVAGEGIIVDNCSRGALIAGYHAKVNDVNTIFAIGDGDYSTGGGGNIIEVKLNGDIVIKPKGKTSITFSYDKLEKLNNFIETLS